MLEAVTSWRSAPAPAREIAQEDIDAALQAWNGDTASKRRVQQYMTAHAREKDTAAWLRTEYGGELPLFPVQLPLSQRFPGRNFGRRFDKARPLAQIP